MLTLGICVLSLSITFLAWGLRLYELLGINWNSSYWGFNISIMISTLCISLPSTVIHVLFIFLTNLSYEQWPRRNAN